MSEAGYNDNIVIAEKRSMGADDFSVYLSQFSVLYIRLGANGSGEMHTEDLVSDENL